MIPAMFREQFRRAQVGGLSPRRAIRLKCTECCGWSLAEAKRCGIVACPLHAYGPATLRRTARARKPPLPGADSTTIGTNPDPEAAPAADRPSEAA